MTANQSSKPQSRRRRVFAVGSILLAMAQLPWLYPTYMTAYAILGGDNGPGGTGIGGYLMAFGVLALPSAVGIVLAVMSTRGSAVRLWKNPGLYGLLLNALWLLFLALALVIVSRN